MVTYLSDDLGADNDAIAVVLNGEKVVASEGWESTECILSQPSNFSIRFGWSDVAAGLIRKYPKGTEYELYVGTNKQAMGKLDGPEVDQAAAGATTVSLHGRDLLAKLHDSYVRAQVPVNVGTYAELVWYALQQVGLVPGRQTASDPTKPSGPAPLGHRTVAQILAAPSSPAEGGSGGNAPPLLGPIDPSILRTDNVANRQIKSGVPIRSILPHRTVQQILDDAGVTGPNAGTVHTTPQAKVGERWLTFVRRYIDCAGLMLWAAADGTFVLSAPDGNQPPSYQLVRRIGTPQASGNIIGCKFKDLATGRHSEAVIYGRGGGKAIGRVKAKGGFVDQEMIDAGYDQPIVYRSRNVHSNAEASFLARRKLSEERRNGYALEYTVSGCTLPYIPDGGANRAVITPDTVVAVKDEHLGIQENFYVETVIRRRSPQTTTTMRLMRVDDLIFGSPDEDEDS